VFKFKYQLTDFITERQLYGVYFILANCACFFTLEIFNLNDSHSSSITN
jgi:hypothetical protein